MESGNSNQKYLKIYILFEHLKNFDFGNLHHLSKNSDVSKYKKKSFKIKINKISIFKYLLTSIIVFGSIGMVMEENLEYKNSIFEFLPSLLLFAIISVIGYLIITYLIDKRTRSLIKGIINEMRK